MGEESKLCIDCGVHKPISEFKSKGVNKSGEERYDSRCIYHRRLFDRKRKQKKEPTRSSTSEGDFLELKHLQTNLSKECYKDRSTEPIEHDLDCTSKEVANFNAFILLLRNEYKEQEGIDVYVD